MEPKGPYSNVSDSVRCAIDMYGPGDLSVGDRQDEPYLRASMNKFARAFGAASLNDEVLRQASPVRYIKHRSPPIMVMFGKADDILEWTQGEEIADALRKNDVPTAKVFLDDIGHNFDWESWNRRPLTRDVKQISLAFLNKYLDGN